MKSTNEEMCKKKEKLGKSKKSKKMIIKILCGLILIGVVMALIIIGINLYM